MRLKDWLGANGVKQTDFAGKIGVSESALSRYTAGSRIPRPPIMRRIARATDGAVTAADFYALAADSVQVPAAAEAAAQ